MDGRVKMLNPRKKSLQDKHLDREKTARFCSLGYIEKFVLEGINCPGQKEEDGTLDCAFNNRGLH